MTSTEVVNVRDLPPGWRADPAYVYCGRPSEYGNPHRVGWCSLCGRGHRRGEAVAAFRADALARADDVDYRSRVERLRGRKLVCFCKPEPCHCDVFLELLSRWGCP